MNTGAAFNGAAPAASAARRPLRPLPWLVPLALVVAFALQGTRGLYETTEGRYAEVAREMVETGHYLEPTLEHRPHWSKPPLTYWSVAAGMRLLGRNEWGVRAANGLAFVLTVLAVAGIGAALWGGAAGPSAGLAAGLIYLSSPLPVVGEASVSADMLLALWETLAVLCYVRAWRAAGGGPGGLRRPAGGGRRRAWLWTLGLWAALGLAFLTKGPPGLLPLLPLGVFHWRAGRPFRLLEPAGLALFAATGLSWYAIVIARRPELLSYLVGQEVVARNFSDRFHRNPQWYGPLVIYGPALLLGQGLWLYHGIRTLGREGLHRPATLVRRLRGRGEPGSLLLLWLLLPLAAFCLSRSRLPMYVLPLYAPIALGLARGLTGPGTGKARESTGARVAAGGLARVGRLAALSAAGLIVLKAASAVVPGSGDMGALHRAVREAETAAGAPGAEIRAYREPALHGLQFYLDGHLRRVSRAGAEPWADESLAQAVEAMAAAETYRSFVLLTRTKWAGELESALRAAGLPYAGSEAPGRALFVVGGGG
ncbi:MAG: ArnT family glycosyltransferase [Gemmatimonadota bacterium]